MCLLKWKRARSSCKASIFRGWGGWKPSEKCGRKKRGEKNGKRLFFFSLLRNPFAMWALLFRKDETYFIVSNIKMSSLSFEKRKLIFWSLSAEEIGRINVPSAAHTYNKK